MLCVGVCFFVFFFVFVCDGVSFCAYMYVSACSPMCVCVTLYLYVCRLGCVYMSLRVCLSVCFHVFVLVYVHVPPKSVFVCIGLRVPVYVCAS